MKPTLLLILIVLSSFSLSAQSTIIGKITDQNDDAIFFATVALYNASDSLLVNAVSTDEDGKYFIKNIKEGTYYIEATMLGYKKETKTNIKMPGDNGQNINLTLAQDAEVLATAEVVAKVPLLEQQSDRLVVNVEGNITGMNGSVLDVMKKVPGMLVIGDKLSMAGQQNITILIDGKSTKYMDMETLLRDMPGDNIKKVEVIHQPGAEFEADGTGAVINIILKKSNLYGTNGRVNLGLGKGKNWKYKTGVTLSHYQGSLNINGGLGFRDSPYYEELVISRRVNGDTYNQVSKDPSFSKTMRGNLGLDWDIDDRHRVGFNSQIIHNVSDNESQNITDINYANGEQLRLITDKVSDDKWDFMTINPYYNFEIDTAGQKLSFDVNLAKYDVKGLSTLSNQEVINNVFFENEQFDQPGLTDIFSSKIDYAYPFSKDLKMQVGAKYSSAKLDNNISKFVGSEGNWSKVDSVSNHYIFKENIGAVYAKLNYKIKKWSGTAGLRYENSQSEGFSEIIDSTSTLTRDISKFFPSMSLKREINKDMAVVGAYSYRINRPRYSSLNPFVFSLDPFTSEQGNAQLAPSYTHSMKGTITYQNQPFISFEYKRNNDAVVDVIQQDDDTGEAFKSEVNLEKLESYRSMVAFPLSFIPKMDGYGVLIADYNKYDSKYLDDQFLASKWSFIGYLNMSYQLPGEINTELTAWYNSGGQEGLLDAEWLYGVDIGVSKKFLDNKLNVSLGVENVLSRFFHSKVEYSNIDLNLVSKRDAPVVNLQFSYKFGNQFIKNKKRHNSSAQEELNRAQQ